MDVPYRSVQMSSDTTNLCNIVIHWVVRAWRNVSTRWVVPEPEPPKVHMFDCCWPVLHWQSSRYAYEFLLIVPFSIKTLHRHCLAFVNDGYAVCHQSGAVVTPAVYHPAVLVSDYETLPGNCQKPTRLVTSLRSRALLAPCRLNFLIPAAA